MAVSGYTYGAQIGFFFFFFYFHLTLHSPNGMAGGSICTPTQCANYIEPQRRKENGEQLNLSPCYPHPYTHTYFTTPNPSPNPRHDPIQVTKQIFHPIPENHLPPPPLPQCTATSFGHRTLPTRSRPKAVTHGSPHRQKPGGY